MSARFPRDIDHPLTEKLRALRYACGCVLFDDNHTIDAPKIADYEMYVSWSERKCMWCFKKEYSDRKKAASAVVKAAKLPRLTDGTIKQKKFANVIRTELFAEAPAIYSAYATQLGLNAVNWIKRRGEITNLENHRRQLAKTPA